MMEKVDEREADENGEKQRKRARKARMGKEKVGEIAIFDGIWEKRNGNEGKVKGIGELNREVEKKR